MFDLGDVVPLRVEIRDTAGALANAGSVAVTVTAPDETSTTPSVGNTSTGVYTATYTPTQIGRHRVRWVATGVNASAFTDVFDVRSGSSIQLFSLTDARAFLHLSKTTNDEELRGWIEAATAAVEAVVGPVVPRTIVENVRASG